MTGCVSRNRNNLRVVPTFYCEPRRDLIEKERKGLLSQRKIVDVE